MSEPSIPEVLRGAEQAVRQQGRAALCQIVRVEGSTPGKPGWKLLVGRDGRVLGNLGGGAFEALVQADAVEKLLQPDPHSEIKRYYFTEKAVRGEATGMVCGGMAEVFVEILQAPPVLFVCGGGPVGRALSEAGLLAGFDVAVAEDRPEFREQDRFPGATRLVSVDRRYSGDFLAELGDRELFVTIVTRCWETDAAALEGMLRQSPAQLRYLGLMGSRRKVERVAREVTDKGYELTGLPYYAPIGLPIGGDSPGEIAISILAQVLQVRYGRAAEAKPEKSARDGASAA